MIPEDGIAAIVDFLGGDELCNLFQANSSMCLVAERVARTRVEEVADQFPTGPICVSSRKCFVRDNHDTASQGQMADPRTEIRPWIYTSNENDFALRAPDDSKTWTGIYHYMEKMTAENYYFGFESAHDSGAVCRFLAQPMEEKFTFDPIVYSKVGQVLRATDVSGAITVKGGQAEVFDDNILLTNRTFISNQALMLTGEGKRRFIGRLFCPGSGSLSPPTRDILGAVGFLRLHRNRPEGDQGADATWLPKSDIREGWLRDDSVFGFEYNPADRSLNIKTFGSSRANHSQSNTIYIPAADAESGDDIVLAIDLTPKAAKEHTMLSVRQCDEDTWARFLDHIPQELLLPQFAEEEAAAADAIEAAMLDDVDGRPQPRIVRRIRRRVDHVRTARRQQAVELIRIVGQNAAGIANANDPEEENIDA